MGHERARTPRTALIVDDEPDILAIGEVSLARLGGWNVLVASSAEKALALAESARPDVVLLDLRMPGTDGASTLGRLKASPATNSIPVIMMTAACRDEAARACLAAGAAGIISKPFDPLHLSARIDLILEAGRKARP